MSMKFFPHVLPLFALLLGGCSIVQTVQPVPKFVGKEVCIIENPAVRSTVFDVYKNSLIAKGYEPRKLAAGSSLITCPITSTYVANWSWDLAMYMYFADIKVYQDAKPAGEAVYDASLGSGNMKKFIKADAKIKELVDQLFPVNAY